MQKIINHFEGSTLSRPTQKDLYKKDTSLSIALIGLVLIIVTVIMAFSFTGAGFFALATAFFGFSTGGAIYSWYLYDGLKSGKGKWDGV